MRLLIAAIVVIVIYMFQKVLFLRLWDRGLSCVCRFSRDYIECGENADLMLTVENAKVMPLPVFNLKFSVDRFLRFADMKNAAVTDKYHKSEVFSVMGNQRVKRNIEFTGTRRGIASISNVSLIVRDYFLTSTFAKVTDDNDTIYVFPPKKTDVSFNVLSRGLIGEVETRRSLVEDRQLLRGIRDYQPFDGKKNINWKQSAKARSLMVNVPGYTMDFQVRLLLNLDTEIMIETNRLIEESISLASSIVRRLLRQKISVSMYVNAEDSNGNLIQETGSGSEISHGITIDKSLTEISRSLGKDVFLDKLDNEMSEASENVLYLIISSYHKDDIMERINRLLQQGAGVSMIVPYYDAYPYKPEEEFISGWEVGLNG